MDQSTRKLLALLGSDACSAICERLEEGAAAKTELAAKLERSGRDVANALDALALIGLVRYSKRRGDGPGRPREVWELATTDELEKLENYVKAMRHRLIDVKKPASRHQH